MIENIIKRLFKTYFEKENKNGYYKGYGDGYNDAKEQFTRHYFKKGNTVWKKRFYKIKVNVKN